MVGKWLEVAWWGWGGQGRGGGPATSPAQGGRTCYVLRGRLVSPDSSGEPVLSQNFLGQSGRVGGQWCQAPQER